MLRVLPFLLVSSLTWAASTPDPPHAVAVRTSTAPVIDGKLDDPVWQNAPLHAGFRQEYPKDGADPTEPTDVRILYDDKNLYFAVRNHDSDPKGIVTRLTRRDRDIEADWLCIYVDSRNDKNTAWFFQLSPAGVKVDGQTFNDNQHSLDWDGVWDGAVSTDAGGWNAEFAIPLTLLRFTAADANQFGFQVLRHVSRKRENTEWAYAPRTVQGYVSTFGKIDGITGIKPRRAFELRPYVLARASASTPEGGGFFGLTGEDVDADLDADLELGLDLKLGLTSELALDATLNPDFGQVEADQVVLNLTRFETFFPEKRPFFLEGRELFETPLQLVYPRRIGRPPTGFGPGDSLRGEEVVASSGSLRIWGASKVTGTIAPKVNFAALAAVTAAEEVTVIDSAGARRDVDASPERLYAALRARWAPSAGSFIGMTATAVTRLGGEIASARLNHDAYTQSIDGWWQPTGRLLLTAQAALSERVGGTALAGPDGLSCEEGPDCRPVVRADGREIGPGDVGFGAQTGFEYSSKHIFSRGSLRTLSPTFDVNDIGFIPQWGRHDVSAVLGYRENDATGIFHNYAIIPFAEAHATWEGKPSWAFAGLDFEAELKGFIFTSPQLGFALPGTYDPLETFDGAYFENKPLFDTNWIVRSNPSARLSGFIRPNYRHDLGGRGWRLGADAGLTLQAASNVELSLEPSVGVENNQLRFFDCQTASGEACVHDDGMRDYTFAELDSRFLSLVFRGTYTLTTTFSVQAYAQLFLADGSFDRFRSTTTMGDRPTIDREDLSLTGEMTDAGDFETAALNLNLVARWEPLRGSTFFFVYTRAQESPFSTLSRLGRGTTVDVLLLKFVYFFGV
jgi:hypothetical protein